MFAPDNRNSPPRSPFDLKALDVGLPKAPPIRKAPASVFDKDHRSDTLLAIGSALLSSQNFGEGLGAAAQNVLGLRQNLRKEERQTHEYGGPDDAFEIITDPRTGERSVNEVSLFRDYLDKKRVKPKDTADINGRAMSALSAVPEADRPAAYAAMRQNPEQYGIDPSNMPAQYDPRYVAMAGQMGMTVAQAQSREQARSNAEATAGYRQNVQADRLDRTNIYRARSNATTAQGEQRLSIAKVRAARPPSRGGRPKAKISKGNSDLSYLQ